MIEIEHAPAEVPRHALPSELIHELRTPLNQIIGYADLLLEQPGGVGLPDLQRVRSAGFRLQAIIEDNFYPILAVNVADSNGFATIARQIDLVSSPGETETEQAVTLTPTSRAQSPQYVLVVDDIEANRDVLVRRLETQGYSMTQCESGEKALELLAAHPFDLVLLDIMMPEMDGFEVLRRLKSDERFQHIPVIMISALSEIESVVRCIEMGAEDYLTKPFNPILLKARVGACLEKKLGRDREMELLSKVQDSYLRLLELETLRDDLTHMIIHDLRTPLTSVIAGMQTVDIVGDLNQDQREVVGIAVAGGQTLVAIINDLLDVEKLESGAMALDRAELSIAKLIGGAVSSVASLAEAKGLMLLWDAAIDTPDVVGDENKLRRILVNLLGNAIKFTPTGGSVTVDAKVGDDEQCVLFSVRDTGEGIPPESFERIFEKFGQVDSRQGGRTNSTGLGLTFCKLAVEAHGGQIGVTSTPGEGSTFWFTIPLAP